MGVVLDHVIDGRRERSAVEQRRLEAATTRDGLSSSRTGVDDNRSILWFIGIVGSGGPACTHGEYGHARRQCEHHADGDADTAERSTCAGATGSEMEMSCRCHALIVKVADERARPHPVSDR